MAAAQQIPRLKSYKNSLKGKRESLSILSVCSLFFDIIKLNEIHCTVMRMVMITTVIPNSYIVFTICRALLSTLHVTIHFTLTNALRCKLTILIPTLQMRK